MLRTAAATPGTLAVERDGQALDLELTPVSYTIFQARQFCGVEVEELDYDVDYQVIQDASRALYKAFTENPDAEPRTLMEGALRVVTANPVEMRSDPTLRKGDLLLGVTRLIYDTTTPRRELVRLETPEELLEVITPYALREAHELECWILRDGEVTTSKLVVKWKR